MTVRHTRIQWFEDMAMKAATLHPWTWCVKRQVSVPTAALSGEECLSCEEFMGNGGICDPL